jgi:predicted nuclease of predicted toxin-antitoxin system
VKFYLDEDLPPQIAAQLRRKGFDAVSAYDVGQVHVPDQAHLAYAAREGRCLVSRNVRHFAQLSQDAVARQEPHGGIVLCPPSLLGREVGAIVDRLIRRAKQFPKGLGTYDVLFL